MAYPPGIITNAQGVNSSPELNVAVVGGDRIECDYGSSTDGLAVGNRFRAHYTDETFDQTFVQDVNPNTITVNMTAGKTLDHIEIDLSISDSVGGPARSTTRDVLEIRLITTNEITATAGKLKTPQAFIEGEGDGAAGGAGGGSGGNLAAISADGLYIYIASFNSLGFPTLIRMPALLNADGTVVFSPSAGGRIGVQAGELNAGMIWVAGSFDGTNTVEKSEDYGATWTVKDDGVFGTVRTFQVGPDDDERVLVFDGDNGDILETLDDGATWTTINATVSPLINSLARLSVDLQEIVAGNEGDVTDSINYSPNSGVNLEDYQTGVYPNADATKVQVT
jgi:hypothetical protein